MKKEEKLKGGISDKLTLADISKKHKIDIDTLKKELNSGIKIEMEHTKDKNVAKEIAMDHLYEDQKYYKKLKTIEKKQEIDEITDASSSGAYDAPFGDGSKNPLKIGGPKSIMKSRAVKDKNFPKWGGPDAVFVKIKEKCSKFPYCNQGDINSLELYEIKGFKEIVEESSKKYGVSIKEIEGIILEEIKREFGESLPKGFFDDSNLKALGTWNSPEEKIIFRVTTNEPLNFKITRESDLIKLKQILLKYDVKFDVEESKKE